MENLHKTIRGQQNGTITDAEYHRNIVDEIIRRIESTRASVWYFNRYRDSIHCEMVYDVRTGQYEQGAELHKEDFPQYFQAMLTGDTIDASDARRHALTSAFAETYFDPLEIHSLLDVPIQIKGIIVGVLCCEHCEEIKDWTKEDIHALQVIAATMSLAIPKMG